MDTLPTSYFLTRYSATDGMGSPDSIVPGKVCPPVVGHGLIGSDRAENAGSLEDRTRRFDGIVGKVIERWNFALNQVDGGLNFDGFIKLIGADRVGAYIRTPQLLQQF